MPIDCGVQNAMNKVMKKKFLFGLIYLRINQVSTDWNLRLFGLTVLKTKVDVLRSRETLFLLGCIPMLKYSILDRLRKSYMQMVCSSFPDYDAYFPFASGCGEIFLMLSHFKEFINQYDYKKPLLIFNSHKLNDIYKLFHLPYDSVVIENVAGLLLDDKCIFLNKEFITPLNYKYFGKTEKKIITGKLHYYESLKKRINVYNTAQLPTITDFDKNKINLIANIILDNNFVIIMPEALTIKELDKEFWEKICTSLHNKGYKVFLNVTNIHNYIKNTVTIFLDYSEMAALACQAKAIIGLRNGFLEVTSMLSNVPSFVIYNKFNSYAQNKLSANQAINGFSMKKLPFKNVHNIYEYNYENYSDELVLQNEIFNDFQQVINTVEKFKDEKTI